MVASRTRPAVRHREGGNDSWGVEVWRDGYGQKYALASDRDDGISRLRYHGP